MGRTIRMMILRLRIILRLNGSQAHGSQLMAQGPWLEAQAHGSRLKAHGLRWLVVRSSWLKAHGLRGARARASPEKVQEHDFVERRRTFSKLLKTLVEIRIKKKKRPRYSNQESASKYDTM